MTNIGMIRVFSQDWIALSIQLAVCLQVWLLWLSRFETYAISVRLGRVISQSVVKNFDTYRYPLSQWKYLCIEGWFYLSLLIVLHVLSVWCAAKLLSEHLWIVLEDAKAISSSFMLLCHIICGPATNACYTTIAQTSFLLICASLRPQLQFGTVYHNLSS